MEKISNILNEDLKKSYKTTINITLDNGMIIEANIDISDMNESFAKDKLKTLKDSKIVSYSIKDIKLSESKSNKNKLKDVFYIPHTPFFTSNMYDIELIKSILKEESCYDIKTITHENMEVVSFKIVNDNRIDYTINKDRIENKLKSVFNSNWIRVSKI